MPRSRAADIALRAVVGDHLRRHARAGVSYRHVASGLLIKVHETERYLELRCSATALDDALRQLGAWSVLR